MHWFDILKTTVFVAVTIGGCFLVRKQYRKKLATLREQAFMQLQNLVVECADERYAFSGATATVIDEVERIIGSEGEIADLWLVLFCRNPHGEYFQFISNSSRKPYIKHVPQNLARIALKKKYVPPEQANF